MGSTGEELRQGERTQPTRANVSNTGIAGISWCASEHRFQLWYVSEEGSLRKKYFSLTQHRNEGMGYASAKAAAFELAKKWRLLYPSRSIPMKRPLASRWVPARVKVVTVR